MQAPRAIGKQRVSRPEDGTLLVQDQDGVGRLSAQHGTIWSACDGATEVDALAALLAGRHGGSVDAERVFVLLDDLADAGLLAGRAAPPAGLPRLHRRQFVGQVAAGAAVVLAAVAVPLGRARASQITEEEAAKVSHSAESDVKRTSYATYQSYYDVAFESGNKDNSYESGAKDTAISQTESGIKTGLQNALDDFSSEESNKESSSKNGGDLALLVTDTDQLDEFARLLADYNQSLAMQAEDFTFSVPEPATLGLLAAALVGFGVLAHRRKGGTPG